MQIFYFRNFFFSQLWRALARKLVKKPAVFITYFQSTIQIVHVYQILSSEYLSPKFVGCFNLMSTFFALHHFPQLWATFATKLMKRPTVFFNILKLQLHFYMFTKLLGEQIIKKNALFQYVHKTLFIPATLSNAFHKNYKKPYNFSNVLLEFHSIYTLSRSFIMTTFLRQKSRPFQYC